MTGIQGLNSDLWLGISSIDVWFPLCHSYIIAVDGYNLVLGIVTVRVLVQFILFALFFVYFEVQNLQNNSCGRSLICYRAALGEEKLLQDKKGRETQDDLCPWVDEKWSDTK